MTSFRHYESEGLSHGILAVLTAAKTYGWSHDPWGLGGKNGYWDDDVNTCHRRMLGRLTVINWGNGWRCVAARKSLIPNSSLHLSGSFRTTEVGSRMLVAGSMSSIMIDPMRLMSARPLSAEKTFRSRIDSAMSASPLDFECYGIYQSWSFRFGSGERCCCWVCYDKAKALHGCRRVQWTSGHCHNMPQRDIHLFVNYHNLVVAFQKHIFDIDKMVACEFRYPIYKVAVGSFHAFDRYKRPIFLVVWGDYSRAILT